MAINKLVTPVVKWVGGKRQIINEIVKYVPKYSTYYEPFMGGGAVLFELQPKTAILNDINSELISLYEVIKNNVDELIESLREHERKNEEAYFYRVREQDRDKEHYDFLMTFLHQSKELPG